MSTFTLDWLKSVSLEAFKKQAGHVAPGSQDLAELNALLSSPEGRAIANEMLNDPDYVPVSLRPPSAEEAAQIVADTARAEAEAKAAADAIAAAAVAAPPPVSSYAVEDAALRAEGISVHRDAQGAVIRIVQDYQVMGENDHPIGRPTHLEARNWPELVLKQKAAHENAVRYAERVKTNKFKAATAVELGDAAVAARADSARLAEEAVNTKDPAKMQEAVQKSIEAEKKSQDARAAAEQRGAIIAEAWMETHENDFVFCDAANKLLSDWLNANRKLITFENLEAAYEAVKHQLPKKVVEIPVVPVVNPPAAATVAPVTPPAAIPPTVPEAAVIPPVVTPPVSQPVAKTPPATPAAVAQSTPAARRPGVNGSLPPGSLTAERPTVTQQPTATRAELLHAINKMTRDEYRRKLRDVNYVKQLEAAGIPVAGQRN